MISGIVTSILLVLFLGGCVWAWRPERKCEFDAAAQLPLNDSSDVASREQQR